MNGVSTKRIVASALVILLGTFVFGGLVSAEPLSDGVQGWKGIIQFEAGTGPALKSALVRGVGGAVEKDLDALDMAIVNLPNEAAANGLAHAKGVLQVEADSIKTFCGQTLPWGVDRIDADQVWNVSKGTQGAGVNVAVLDTGIDTNHPDLAANLAGKYSCVNTDPENVEDTNGHGTHCSGIIAAMNNEIGVVGVGPEINLYMVQVSRKSTIAESAIIEGINWCIATHTDSDPDNDIQVMSMSFGGGYSVNEDNALQDAYNEGIVLVAAAGNERRAVIFPAALPNVIAVSATNASDQFAYFSNFGPEIDLAAPGVSILSTYLNDGYATMSGTSMACPHVAGAAAMVIASGIRDTNDNERINDEVEARLKDTAEDIGLPSEQQGAGLVDVEQAVLGNAKPQPAIAVKVDQISFSGKKNGRNYFLSTKIQVSDQDNQAVSGATINMTLNRTSEPANSWTVSGVTASDGTVTFTLAKTIAGDYMATINAVNRSGYAWSGFANTASCTLNSDGTITPK